MTQDGNRAALRAARKVVSLERWSNDWRVTVTDPSCRVWVTPPECWTTAQTAYVDAIVQVALHHIGPTADAQQLRTRLIASTWVYTHSPLTPWGGMKGSHPWRKPSPQ